MADFAIPFDPECITARILAEELRDMMAKAGIDADGLGARIGIDGESVGQWLHGRNLKQPVRFLAAVDACGYDVKFVKRKTPPIKYRRAP